MNNPTQPTPEVISATAEVSSVSNDMDLIQKANFAADRLEAANKELAKLLSIQQKLAVERTLGGQTTTNVKSETSEEKQLKAAKEMLMGTGMEDYAFPDVKL